MSSLHSRRERRGRTDTGTHTPLMCAHVTCAHARTSAHTSHVHTLRLSSFFSRLAHHDSRLSPRNLAPEKPDSPPCCSPSSFGTQR